MNPRECSSSAVADLMSKKRAAAAGVVFLRRQPFLSGGVFQRSFKVARAERARIPAMIQKRTTI